MALGASFQAANLSHYFKVREIWLDDGFDFEIFLHIKNLEETAPESENFFNKSLTLFNIKKRFGSKKQISFSFEQNL